jgi:hypothetical protein
MGAVWLMLWSMYDFILIACEYLEMISRKKTLSERS